MHAKGAGAFGTFTVTNDISKYTRASIFSEVGKQTPCFVRFSTVAGERGAADEEARTYKVNPFDLTKVWYHGDFPLHDVGILELNRNPENYFAEVEQAAFNPANVIEGIGFSPDKMLQGRLFSYGDAH